MSRRRINPQSDFRRFGLPQFASHNGNQDRRRILENVKRVRDGTGVAPRNFGTDGGWGRVQLCIPEFDYPFITAMFPELKARDHETRTRGWQRFIRSPMSEPYRTFRITKGVARCRSITEA